VLGDAAGRLVAGARLRDGPDVETRSLKRVHAYPAHAAAITALASAPRGKTFLAADAAGRLTYHDATIERTVAKASVAESARQAFVAPKLDGILVLSASGLSHFSLDAPHPEMSLRALFGKVLYEGYDRPDYLWQSSASTEEFEPKLSFVPLVFGTIKGTLYAMLFAIPVSLTAALYTALFAHRSVKSFVKPVVEIMAAVPSVVIGFLAGLWLSPLVERNTVATLLVVPLIPLTILGGVFVFGRLPEPVRRRFPNGAELFVALPLVLVAGALAVVVAPLAERLLFAGDFKAWLLASAGLRYDARNSLVIGFAMGLAVIPIIFTIAEDALSSVPQHLKAASLALGATPWQTATRVVLPTASPGIFSAIMVGFGRAVGETMIVLMATGNTPILDWSLFNGMRTLAANIAVEISEAPQGGTLYRTLFLAALLLFVLTFVVNTAAEVTRQRLRKKYAVI
jgi:phosphate transport system permease protein